MYKRYMVFILFDAYDSAGGLFDCENSFDTLQDAQEFVSNRKLGNSIEYQIFDRIDGIKIEGV